jgi:hypothetical protein
MRDQNRAHKDVLNIRIQRLTFLDIHVCRFVGVLCAQ